MEKVTEFFGSDVFGDAVMKERLPEDVYKAIKKTAREGKSLDSSIADTVAAAMKEWAISKGATHFTHWFQPLTGITAEKHDSFIEPAASGVIMEFSGKELIKGETDGSSFPSGGLRATFEARGYTAWDPSSYAFVKDGSLCIPTAFCSFGGESLDKKTPLLRSMQAIDKAALRLLKLFGHENLKSVYPTVGAEQEYFLIDEKLYACREDLRFCSRTLFGAMPPKSQELSDHYYGVIKTRVSEFMKDLDAELWKKGIYSKTKHNEVAPSQHEMAPVFTTVNIATDHNQLTMEIMKKVAERHGMVCILHEKPFKGVNGSGKHNNWSLTTDKGVNLLNPGKTPSENKQFLLILCALIKAVDMHQDLLRLSVASAGNDHRLGAQEAPPAIISMFIGDDLTEILESVEKSQNYIEKDREQLDTGAVILPHILRDNTDRNRTSPFAFTGNKFEFRMPGATDSIACANTVINTIVADVFEEFADRLTNAEDFEAEVYNLIKETYKEHKRIIFSGDGYSKEWEKEALNRGLLNLKDTVSAFSHYCDAKNIELFARHGIYSETELRSRTMVLVQNYSKVIMIEGKTALSMLKSAILPAYSEYTAALITNANLKKSAGLKATYEKDVAKSLSEISEKIYEKMNQLNLVLERAKAETETFAQATVCRDEVIPLLEGIRALADSAEPLLAEDYQPFPTYKQLLFGI